VARTYPVTAAINCNKTRLLCQGDNLPRKGFPFANSNAFKQNIGRHPIPGAPTHTDEGRGVVAPPPFVYNNRN